VNYTNNSIAKNNGAVDVKNINIETIKMSDVRLSYVEPIELLSIMGVDCNDHDCSPCKSDFVIIDVRDDDFSGGNLVGALNYTSVTFESKLDEVYNKCREKNCVIFHCAQSKVRGPTCARRFIEYINTNSLPHKNVRVLSGGYLNIKENYLHLRNIFENQG